MIQKLLARPEPGLEGEEIPVISGDALSEPEGARVILAGVIERPQCCGAKPLHVPEVEEFMSRRLQRFLRALPDTALNDDLRRIQMLHAISHRDVRYKMENEK